MIMVYVSSSLDLCNIGICQGKAEEILAFYSSELNDVVTDDENSLPQVCAKIPNVLFPYKILD